jgi:mannose-6-phosphate isomerase-like protein (cupin superfamily)
MDHKPRDPSNASLHAGDPSDASPRAGEMHYRNAIDLIMILQGGAELILGDGGHPVEAGDCIVMPGSDHGLRAGPNGCRLMSFAIGTPMPA